MSQSLEEWMIESSKLPTLPAVYHRLQKEVNDTNTTVEQIAATLSNDPALSLRLLRLANSGFYGFPAKISSIDEAVTLIGLHQIRDLVIGTVIVETFSGIMPQWVNMDSFWKHSIACGIAARLIAEERNESNQERLFAAGLLHDIGLLLLYLKMPEESSRLIDAAKADERPLFEHERELLGFDHMQTGAALLKEWNLPEAMVEAVKFHHLPLESKVYQRDVLIVHVADVMANTLEIGSSGENGVPQLDPRALEHLSVTMKALEPVMEETSRQIDELSQIILET